MTTESQYLGLITTEHKQRPKFIATLSAVAGSMAALQEVLASFKGEFDVDTAIGAQLDIIGIWVGISRRVAIPLVGVYFTWNDTVATGWNSGVWKGEFDPVSGLTSLPDDSYRILIKAKIAANAWDGSIPGAYTVWQAAFGDDAVILIQDNQDMSMVVGIVNTELSAVTLALLTGGYIPLKPAGVRIDYYAVVQDGNPAFAWNIENENLAGWGTGSWAKNIPVT